MLKRGQYGRFVGAATKEFFGVNVYRWFVLRSSPDVVRVDVMGNEMLLDLTDPGISFELYLDGIREERSTEAFIAELETLRRSIDWEINVIEVGANIGYYAIIEADHLGQEVLIHAFEPSPDNVAWLERNIELNGFSDRFRTHRRAMGAEEQVADFRLAERSNRHRLAVGSAGSDFIDDTGESISVDVGTVDQEIEENDLAPGTVNVVRMDVQGAEYDVFRGMEGLLNSDGPLLLFLETHASLTREQTSWMFSLLERNDFSIVSVAYYETCEAEVDSFEELVNIHEVGSYEIIVRRGYGAD